MDSPEPTNSLGRNITPGTNDQVIIAYSKRTVRMHHVTETELRGIASLGNSANLAFLGISFGALVGFAITLATVPLVDPATHASFVSLVWLSAIASLYFGIRSIVDGRNVQRRIKEIMNSDDFSSYRQDRKLRQITLSPSNRRSSFRFRVVLQLLLA